MRLTPDPSTGSIATEILSRASLRHEINKRTQWEILRPEGIAPLHISCPNDVVEHIWTDQGLPFPPLENITNTPFFDGRGELIVTPGYHAPCRTYFYSAPGFSIPPVPQNPSEADIEHAKTLLLDNVFIDFPYSDETQGAASRAHALALLLQSFVREFIQGPTPIYLVQKPAPGTGASLLVNAISHIVFGGPAEAQSEKRTASEYRKSITAHLLSKSPLFWIDNVHCEIDDASLAAATTSTVWRDRVLGESRMVTVPVSVAWVISGNNVVLSMELARRTVLIRLDSNLEAPTEGRKYKHPHLINWIKDNRPKLVWSCLTLIQNWVATGKPSGQVVLPSFELWSRTMGGILDAVGVPGFLENRGEVKAATGDADGAVKAFVEVWWSRFAAKEVMLGTLANNSVAPNHVNNAETLLELLLIYSGEIDLGFNSHMKVSWQRDLGRTLTANKDRVFEFQSGGGTSVKIRIRYRRTRWGMRAQLERLP